MSKNNAKTKQNDSKNKKNKKKKFKKILPAFSVISEAHAIA